MRFFDAHTHPNCPPLTEEFPEIYHRCLSEHVMMNVVGNDLADSKLAVAMVHSNPTAMVCTIGIHPHECHRYNLLTAQQTLEKLLLEARAQGVRVVAIGECGLDFSRHADLSPLEVEADIHQQVAFFEMQMQLSKKYHLPLMCHIRDAHTFAQELLTKWGYSGANQHNDGLIIHCFTADWTVAQKYLSQGAYLSIPGIVTFKKAVDLQEAVVKIPLDRLLLETDAPFLAPVPHRGHTNYPYYVQATAEFVAQLRGIPLAVLAEATFQNAETIFNLPKEETPWLHS